MALVYRESEMMGLGDILDRVIAPLCLIRGVKDIPPRCLIRIDDGAGGDALADAGDCGALARHDECQRAALPLAGEDDDLALAGFLQMARKSFRGPICSNALQIKCPSNLLRLCAPHSNTPGRLIAMNRNIDIFVVLSLRQLSDAVPFSTGLIR